MAKKISPEKRKRIIKLAKEGVPSREISERTGVSMKAIRTFCQEANVELAKWNLGLRFWLTPDERKAKQEGDVADRSGNF